MGHGVSADRGEALVGARVVGTGRTPPAPGPLRGDVHFIDFPDLGGNVIRGPHPAVVVRTDRMARSTTVIVAHGYGVKYALNFSIAPIAASR